MKPKDARMPTKKPLTGWILMHKGRWGTGEACLGLGRKRTDFELLVRYSDSKPDPESCRFNKPNEWVRVVVTLKERRTR